MEVNYDNFGYIIYVLTPFKLFIVEVPTTAISSSIGKLE